MPGGVVPAGARDEALSCPTTPALVGPRTGGDVSKAGPSRRRGRPTGAARAALKAAGLMPTGWKHGPRGQVLPGVGELTPVDSYPSEWTGMPMGRKGALFIYHQIDGTNVVRRTMRRPMELGVKTRVMVEVHFDVRTPIYIIGNQEGHRASEIIPEGCPLPGTDMRE